ncbi:hypothetical protein Tco_1191442 [Tanacetum coccineum]|uniref:Uncharacterized protein n=1 Tax=Tanacetum coccineum TaxID=301880 RepID=A0ABQ4XUH6_9ASTR
METIHVKVDELTKQMALANIEHSSEESSSGDVSSAESTQVIQPHNHLGKWSKDHVSPKLNRSLQPAKGDSQLV